MNKTTEEIQQAIKAYKFSTLQNIVVGENDLAEICNDLIFAIQDQIAFRIEQIFFPTGKVAFKFEYREEVEMFPNVKITKDMVKRICHIFADKLVNKGHYPKKVYIKKSFLYQTKIQLLYDI
jgi:hypothetical protein